MEWNLTVNALEDAPGCGVLSLRVYCHFATEYFHSFRQSENFFITTNLVFLF